MVHELNWVPEKVSVQVRGAVKALSVRYDLALTGPTQLDLSMSELANYIIMIYYKKKISELAIGGCAIQAGLPGHAQGGDRVLSHIQGGVQGSAIWLVVTAEISLDKHLAAEYRRRTLNNKTYQDESLF